MKAEELSKTIKQWAEEQEGRHAAVVLVEQEGNCKGTLVSAHGNTRVIGAIIARLWAHKENPIGGIIEDMQEYCKMLVEEELQEKVEENLDEMR